MSAKDAIAKREEAKKPKPVKARKPKVQPVEVIEPPGEPVSEVIE